MMSIERAVESNIKPFLYLIRKPRNNQKQSGNSIVGHPVYRIDPISILPVSIFAWIQMRCSYCWSRWPDWLCHIIPYRVVMQFAVHRGFMFWTACLLYIVYRSIVAEIDGSRGLLRFGLDQHQSPTQSALTAISAVNKAKPFSPFFWKKPFKKPVDFWISGSKI